jgi:hypothetical protein
MKICELLILVSKTILMIIVACMPPMSFKNLSFQLKLGALGGWLALWNLYSQALVTFLAFPFLYAGKFHQK